MSDENNEPQAVVPQAAVQPINTDTVFISPLGGAGMEYKGSGLKPGNGDRGLTASGEGKQK